MASVVAAIRVLGPVEIVLDGQVVPVPGVRPLTLLVRLALSAGALVPVDLLVDDIWGSDPPASAVNTVQVMVSGLRKLLDPSIIRTQGRAYALGDGATVDATGFRQELGEGLLAAGRADDASAALWFRRGLRRWGGVPFTGLEGIEFLDVERAGLTDLYLAATVASAAIRIRQGQAAAVVTELVRLIAIHPYHEGLRAQMVMALGVSGRQVEALGAYQQAQDLLADTFGIDAGAQLRDAQQAVLQGDLPAQAVMVTSRLRLGLAEVPARLIARTTEVGSIDALCSDPSVRLVTLLGTGGVGKTRIAQEMVLRSSSDAVFVSLLAAERAEDVPATICESLGIPVDGGPPESALLPAIAEHPRDLLLVLDNFEHVLDARGLVDRLLAAAHRLTVVVTSRSPLGLSAERRVTVAPLATDGGTGTVSEAAALLLDRITGIDSGFRPTAEDLVLVQDISNLCDGLPLAIELAAARTSLLDLAELRERLGHQLSVLEAPSGWTSRWSSVAASIQWSMSALPKRTIRILMAATVFRGGFTTGALGAVAGLDDEAAAEGVQRLLDHSLITRDGSSRRRRFDILQVVREVGMQSLSPTEMKSLQDHHVHYFTSLVGPQPDFRPYPNRQRDFDLIAGERPNFRAAVRHAATMGTPALADLVVSLTGGWSALGLADELRGWIGQVLARPDLEAGRRVDCMMGMLRTGLPGDDELQLLRQVWSQPVATDERWRRQWLICWSATNAALRGNTGENARLLAESSADAAELDHAPLDCERLTAAGYGHYFNDEIDLAVVDLTQAWNIANAHELDRAALLTGHDLSEMLLMQGSASEAASVTSTLIATTHPEDYHRGTALSNHGAALILLGRPEEAEQDVRRAMAIFARAGETDNGLETLMRIGAAVASADPVDVRSAFLYAVWAAGLEELQIPVQPFAADLVERFLHSQRDAPLESPQGMARRAGADRVATLGAAQAFQLTAAEEA